MASKRNTLNKEDILLTNIWLAPGSPWETSGSQPLSPLLGGTGREDQDFHLCHLGQNYTSKEKSNNIHGCWDREERYAGHYYRHLLTTVSEPWGRRSLVLFQRSRLRHLENDLDRPVKPRVVSLLTSCFSQRNKTPTEPEASGKQKVSHLQPREADNPLLQHQDSC